MGTTDSNRLARSNLLGQVTRLVILAYFLGIGLGIFPGSRVDKVFQPFASNDGAFIMAGGLIFGLVALILLDIQRKLAAGGLALLVFLASYIELVSASGNSAQIGIFWRDLGAIGLLLYSVSVRDQDDAEPESSRAQAETKRSDTDDVAPSESAPRHPRRVRTEIYRQDFEEVRIH